MTQSTILAEGSSRAMSSDVPVAAGAVVTIGLFVSSGVLPPDARAVVYVDTPGLDNREIDLDRNKKQTQFNGPATYRVERVSGAFGIFEEA